MVAARTGLAGVLAACQLFALAPATAQTVRLTKLSDVAFGSLSSTASDVVRTQNVCAYSSNVLGTYSVRVLGSGSGSALTLAGVGTPLAYEVQWAAAAGQSSGTALPANTTVGGFYDLNVLQTCSGIITSSASLIVILRAAALSSATAGSYSGTLTIVLAAE